MNLGRSASHFLAAAIAVALSACTNNDLATGVHDDFGDSVGPFDDGASRGHVQLVVGGATWADVPNRVQVEGRQGLAVDLTLTNGEGAAGILPVPSLFTVETNQGSGVMGLVTVTEGECPSDVTVIGGASRSCRVWFEVPTGETPLRLIYATVDGRSATGRFVRCSTDEPRGLCPQSETCHHQGCVARCSANAPTGLCPEATDRCREGRCVPPCSAAAHDGHCAEGICTEGICDVCPRFNRGEACNACETQVEIPFPERCVDCLLHCALSRPSWCTCFDDVDACRTCEAEVKNAIWFIMDACPACRSN